MQPLRDSTRLRLGNSNVIGTSSKACLTSAASQMTHPERNGPDTTLIFTLRISGDQSPKLQQPRIGTTSRQASLRFIPEQVRIVNGSFPTSTNSSANNSVSGSMVSPILATITGRSTRSRNISVCTIGCRTTSKIVPSFEVSNLRYGPVSKPVSTYSIPNTIPTIPIHSQISEKLRNSFYMVPLLFRSVSLLSLRSLRALNHCHSRSNLKILIACSIDSQRRSSRRSTTGPPKPLRNPRTLI